MDWPKSKFLWTLLSVRWHLARENREVLDKRHVARLQIACGAAELVASEKRWSETLPLDLGRRRKGDAVMQVPLVVMQAPLVGKQASIVVMQASHSAHVAMRASASLVVLHPRHD